MSSSRRMFFDGRRQPGRSNFVQTCNLLSRYIKEKGSLRDLNLEIGGKVESLEAIVKPGSTHSASASTTINNISAQPSMVMEQQQPPMAPISSINEPLSKEDPKPSQLTIFYSGKVLVFDNCPSNKAQELIAFAEKECSQISCGILPNIVAEKSSPIPSSREGLPPRPQASTSPQTCKEKTSCSSNEATNGSDLPIARRSSLHRFLEKRKDRAVGRGPYYHQVEEHGGSSCKGDEQLELRL